MGGYKKRRYTKTQKNVKTKMSFFCVLAKGEVKIIQYINKMTMAYI